MSGISEVARVQEHLRGALDVLSTRAVRPGELDSAAQLTRMLLRAELERYRAEGLFPQNHDHAALRPSFIDEHGTRCAMAHLMELGGASALVAEVAQTANHAYVDELAADPRFLAWLEAAGLTVAEAARIQPSYPSTCVSAARCACTMASLVDGQTVDGAIVASVVESDSSDGALRGRIEIVYGDVPYTIGQVIQLHVPAQARHAPTVPGDRVFVPIVAAQRSYEVLAWMEPDGTLNASCNMGADPRWDPIGYSQVGELPVRFTPWELAELRKQPSLATCEASLEKKDVCWGACPATREPDPAAACVYTRGLVENVVPSDAGTERDASGPVVAYDAGTGARDAGTISNDGTGYGGQTSTGSATETSASTAGWNIAGGGCAASTSAAAPSSVAVLLAVTGALVARQRRSRRQ